MRGGINEGEEDESFGTPYTKNLPLLDVSNAKSIWHMLQYCSNSRMIQLDVLNIF